MEAGKKIKFGLIGCGKIARKHVSALSHLVDLAKVVGAFDVRHEAAVSFSKQYGVPVFKTVEEMVTSADPDVFAILTPSGLHAESILELVHFRKHFVVEKPLALRLDRIDCILEECDRRQLKIFVVQQNRFNPPIQQLRVALEKGRFGRLVLGTVRVRWSRTQAYYDEQKWRGTWEFDGGVLANQASHHIDMLTWMMGDVESVVARTTTRLAKIEAEDTAVALLKFKSGALGVIEATTATRPKDLEGSISILGEKGSVEIGGFFMNELKTWLFSEQDEMDAHVWRKSDDLPEKFALTHRRFYEDVIRSIHNGTRGLVDGLEGRKTVELISALYESAETGREVFLRFTPVRCRLGLSMDDARQVR